MSVTQTLFGKLPDGREAQLYTLKSCTGMTAEITNFGCRLVRLLVADKAGTLGDVVQGHRTLEEYFGSDFHGAFIGRYANRIGGAAFTLNGKTYTLEQNDGRNALHGGSGGFHQILWDAQVQDGDEPSIVFTHVSPDGAEGYPGEMNVTVTYTLTRENAITMQYYAESDKACPCNLTNHAYFNLSGDYQKKILGTCLTLNANEVTAITDDLIPTGELLPVAGGPLDFTVSKKMGDDMFSDLHVMQICGGYDHNFCIAGEGFRKFGEAWEPDSGRVMEIWSDLPGVQLYTFNNIKGEIDKNGVPMQPHTAFCLETQFYPDSVHHENFPFGYLQPGKPFTTKTMYRFSVK